MNYDELDAETLAIIAELEYIDGPFGGVMGCTAEDMSEDMYLLSDDDLLSLRLGVDIYGEDSP